MQTMSLIINNYLFNRDPYKKYKSLCMIVDSRESTSEIEISHELTSKGSMRPFFASGQIANLEHRIAYVTGVEAKLLWLRKSFLLEILRRCAPKTALTHLLLTALITSVWSHNSNFSTAALDFNMIISRC